jgi:hypothetical protein
MASSHAERSGTHVEAHTATSQEPAHCRPAAAAGHTEKVKFVVNWAGTLEPIRGHANSTVESIRDLILSSPAPSCHKLLIFKGRLLDPALTLKDAGLCTGCVVHLTLNEDPEKGKAIFVSKA